MKKDNRLVCYWGNTFSWNLILSINVKNGFAVIQEAKIRKDTSWPPYFDKEDKDCVISSFENVSLAVKDEFSHQVDWKLCSTAKPEETKEDKDNF